MHLLPCRALAASRHEWRCPPKIRYSSFASIEVGISRRRLRGFVGMVDTSQKRSDPRPRILVLTRYTRRGASSRVRFLQFLPALQLQFNFEVSSFFDDPYIDALYNGSGYSWLQILSCYFRRLRVLRRRRSCDLIWLEKEALPWIPAAVERLLLGRTRYVLDIDDAWFHRYDMHPSAFVRASLARKIDSLMRDAAVVVAGNEYLAKRARSAGAARVIVIPSAIDLDVYPPAVGLHPSAKTHDAPIIVGWIGTPVTAPYLRLIETALRDFAREIPTEIRIVGAPVPAELDGLPAISRPWTEEGQIGEILQLDIGMMPLEDTAWEQGKCAYKLLQIMAAGRPVIGSRVGANCTVVQEGVNGLLASSNEEWLQALRLLARDAVLRGRLGLAARKSVEKKYSLLQLVPLIAEALQVAIDRTKSG